MATVSCGYLILGSREAENLFPTPHEEENLTLAPGSLTERKENIHSGPRLKALPPFLTEAGLGNCLPDQWLEKTEAPR